MTFQEAPIYFKLVPKESSSIRRRVPTSRLTLVLLINFMMRMTEMASMMMMMIMVMIMI